MFGDFLLRPEAADDLPDRYPAVTDVGKKVFLALKGQILGDCCDLVALGDVGYVDPSLSQAFFQDFLSQVDAQVPFLAHDPLSDLGPGLGGFHEIEPILAGMMLCGGDDLHDVAVAQLVAQGHHPAVDASADALVADFRVNGVGEIHRGGAFGKLLDLPGGGEHIDLVREKIHAHRVHEFPGVLETLLPLQELPEPGELFFIDLVCRGPLLVFPVGGNPLFRNLVHVPGPDLDLHTLPEGPDHRGMEGLVHVGLG